MAKKDNGIGMTITASGDGVPFEVYDAYHTLRHAHKIVQNKSLMNKVKAHHETVRAEHAHFNHAIGRLAKAGRISPKAMRGLRTPKIKKLRRPHVI